MNVKFSLYEIPLPGEQTEDSRPQARVHTNGTIRLNDICNELRDLGVNSAQIKAVLDATAKYLGKSLAHGYNFELEGIGTFSLSLHCDTVQKQTGEAVRVKAGGVNFRCGRSLKEKVSEVEFRHVKHSSSRSSLKKRKKQMIDYLEKQGYINISKYALLNNCSRYQARKDIESFVEEELIISSGAKSHKVYVLI